MRECVMRDCAKPHLAKGYCSMHYQRVRLHGDPHRDRRHFTFEDVVEYFYAKCPTTPPGAECWEWPIVADKKWPYGKSAKRWTGHAKAHRLSYFIHFEDIPEGAVVRHRCDNPICVNPHHLELGTHADNMRDMSNRGRSFNGSGRPPMTAEEVREIRRRCPDGRGTSDLARELGRSVVSVWKCATGETYKWVDSEGGDPIAVNPSG